MTRRLDVTASGTVGAGLPLHEPACPNEVLAIEDVEGSYFVAAYPPFSRWRPEQLPAWQRRLARPPVTDPPPLGLYVHVPFCARRCDFCYYLAYDDAGPGRIGEYLEALGHEAAGYGRSAAITGRVLDFAYFGGGTPSLLHPREIRSLMRTLKAAFDWGSVREITWECAPQTVNDARLGALREAGVTRLSLGVQQMNDEVLQKSGRIHQVRDVERAWKQIDHMGFPIVNLDLIVGMIGETDTSFFDSLDRVVELAPESITIYQLEIPRHTPLARSIRDGEMAIEDVPSWETKRRRLGAAFEHLEDRGYHLRSAYTAVRDPELHPFLYMDEQYRGADLIGLGAASFSYLDGIHQQNADSLDTYLAAIDRGELAGGRAYELDADERAIRELILQLKLGNVPIEPFRQRHGRHPVEAFGAAMEALQGEGYLLIEHDAIRVTRTGLLRIDQLLPAFYSPAHRDVRYT